MRSRAALAAAGLAALLAAGLGVTFAAFSATTSNPASTFSAKRIYTGTRSVTQDDLRDASGGAAETNSTNVFATASDGKIQTTTNWTNAFAANRYLEFTMDGPLPAGIAASSVQFNLQFTANGGAETGSFYVEVYKASNSTLLATYGSSGTPSGTATAPTQTTFTVSLPVVTTTDIANDLKVRVYGKESNNKGFKVELATVTGSTPYQSFTLYDNSYWDQADSTGVAANWPLALSSDTTYYTSVANWANAFSSSRYLKLSSSSFVPTGATITGVTFNFSYRNASGGGADHGSWYCETYDGATLLGTHGSAGSPISTNVASTAFTSDTVSFPEITSPADANNLTIKVYMTQDHMHQILLNLAKVNVTYYLD